MKRKPALAMLAGKSAGPVDLTALADAAGFENVTTGRPGEMPFDILTSNGVKAKEEPFQEPLPVNTGDAVARFRASFAAWAKDKPKRALVVAEKPVLLGLTNGKRMVVARLAAR